MKFYVDSSVVLTIFFREQGYQNYQALFTPANELVSSCLIEAESLAAIVREKCDFSDIMPILDRISLCFPDRSLRVECFGILSKGYCRGADLLHLATALYLDPAGKELGFLTADKNQKNIAAKLGFRTK